LISRGADKVRYSEEANYVFEYASRTFAIVIATGALAGAAALSGAISAQALHSEPAPIPTATLTGTAYVGVEPPPGLRKDRNFRRRGPSPERGVKITVTRDGELVAQATTAKKGGFSVKVRPGRYVVSAFLGPPKSTPGHICETVNLSLAAQQRVHLRVICNLR
jgi:hypothetical protein